MWTTEIANIKKSFESEACDEMREFEKMVHHFTRQAVSISKSEMSAGYYARAIESERKCYEANIQELRDSAKQKLTGVMAAQAVKYMKAVDESQAEWYFLRKVRAIVKAVQWIDEQ